MKLYHGSENIIEKPVYGKGARYNDYGKGQMIPIFHLHRILFPV